MLDVRRSEPCPPLSGPIDKTDGRWQRDNGVAVTTKFEPRIASKDAFESFATSRAELLLEYLNDPSWRQRWQVWRRHAADPELRKILGRIHVAIVTAQRLDAPAGGIGDEGRERASLLLAGDLRNLSLDSALEVVDGLDQLLIERGDERYLRDVLAVEIARDRIDTTATTWSHVFGAPPPKEEIALIDGGLTFDGTGLSAVRNQLAALYRTRSVLYDLHRARQGMKTRHLLLLAPVLAALLIAFGAVSYVAGAAPSSIALAAVAGGLGAALSGTLKLRDQISNINDLRAFGPSVVIQPLIGAAAGLLLLLVLESGLIKVGWGGSEWATRGVIAFVGGYSEPFFLGIVGRVSSIGEAGPAGAPPPNK